MAYEFNKEFHIKRNTVSPGLTVSLGIDLSGASLKFRMVSAKDGTEKVLSNANAVSPATAGIAKYDWAEADTDTEGVYKGIFLVTSGGKEGAYPSKGHIVIYVESPAGE